jgi:hypothetical protein
MDMRQATEYLPLHERRLAIDLSRIRTPQDVVDFVARYGLLQWTMMQPLPPAGSEQSELLEEFHDHARTFNDLLHQHLRLRQVLRGDRRAYEQLRNEMTGYQHLAEREFLIAVADWIGWSVSHKGLWGSEPYLYADWSMGADMAGRFQLAIRPKRLVDCCFLNLAQFLAGSEPLRECEQCGAVFEVADGRQRFCTPECGARARFQRYMDKDPTRRQRTRVKASPSSTSSRRKRTHS